MSSVKNIPLHAERRFSELAAAYGATCNKSTEDEKGWDYLLQFQARQLPRIPLDMVGPTRSCFIQIKSNSGAFRGVRLKLSNALEFATNKSPCFVVLFPYDEDAKPQNDIFVLHFWEREIEKTLKKVRELEAEGRKDLHNLLINFPLREMKKLPANDAVSEVHRTLEEYGEDYGERKRAISKTVGFEDVAVEATIKFVEGTTISDIVDLHLGIRQTLDVAGLSSRTIRFGIPAREPEVQTEAGKLSIEVTPLDAVAVFSSEVAGREVAVNGKLFGPAWQKLPKEERRLRFISPLIEVRFRPHPRSATFRSNWDTDALYTISEAEQFVDILEVFSSCDVKFALLIDGVCAVSGDAPLKSFPVSPINRVIGRYVKFLASHLKEHNAPRDFRLTLAQLYAAAEDIDAHNELIEANEFGASVRVLWDGKERFGKRDGKAFYYTAIELGEVTIYTIVRRSCTFIPTRGAKLKFKLRGIESISVSAIQGTRGQTEAQLIEELDARAKPYAADAVVVLKNFGKSIDD